MRWEVGGFSSADSIRFSLITNFLFFFSTQFNGLAVDGDGAAPIPARVSSAYGLGTGLGV